MGNKLKDYREKVGVSQSELARLSGVSRGTIISLENNPNYTTTTRTLLKLSKALNASIDAIFFAEDVQHLNT